VGSDVDRSYPYGRKPRLRTCRQPTRFSFVVNFKTAKVLGLALPASILLRADEVIE
jgi:putative ABC transport system substrate-binding protein